MDDPTYALPGAMGALLGKLDAPGNNTPNDVKEMVKHIKHIHKSSVDLSKVEGPPLMAKLWMKEVRELYCDMEDQFAQSLRTDATDDVGENAMKIANKVLDFFGARVQHACARQKSCEFGSLTPRRFLSDGPRRPPNRHEHLIDDHGPMEELLNSIVAEKGEQFKVVSILGAGGVGKTTLARRIYQKLRGRFECRAFVRVTSYPDMRRLLTSIFIQIQPELPRENWDAKDLIDNIAGHLANKRYFARSHHIINSFFHIKYRVNSSHHTTT